MNKTSSRVLWLCAVSLNTKRNNGWQLYKTESTTLEQIISQQYSHCHVFLFNSILFSMFYRYFLAHNKSINLVKRNHVTHLCYMFYSCKPKLKVTMESTFWTLRNHFFLQYINSELKVKVTMESILFSVWVHRHMNNKRCYMCIQWTRVLYSIVITWQSSPPISQFNSMCNAFTSVWSMLVYNTFSQKLMSTFVTSKTGTV